MRNLPIYLVLDFSRSQSGEIGSLSSGLRSLTSNLRFEPFFLESISLSIITFDGSVRQVAPLADLSNFRLPDDIQVHSDATLGQALVIAGECINRELRTSTTESDPNLPPLIIIMTDGPSGDGLNLGLEELKRAATGPIIACAVGQYADAKRLKLITEFVALCESLDQHALGIFFKWALEVIDVQFGIEAPIATARSVVIPRPPPEIALA